MSYHDGRSYALLGEAVARVQGKDPQPTPWTVPEQDAPKAYIELWGPPIAVAAMVYLGRKPNRLLTELSKFIRCSNHIPAHRWKLA